MRLEVLQVVGDPVGHAMGRGAKLLDVHVAKTALRIGQAVSIAHQAFRLRGAHRHGRSRPRRTPPSQSAVITGGCESGVV